MRPGREQIQSYEFLLLTTMKFSMAVGNLN